MSIALLIDRTSIESFLDFRNLQSTYQRGSWKEGLSSAGYFSIVPSRSTVAPSIILPKYPHYDVSYPEMRSGTLHQAG